MQIPLYTASIFQSENDGEGMNVVLYFKLSEKYSKDLSEQFRENITVSYWNMLFRLFYLIFMLHVTEDFVSITVYD